MRGTHRVVVQNKRIRYDFEVKRNITVIRGDSATGKTALVDMIREHYENGEASAVELTCDRECAVLEGRSWAVQLAQMKDSIVFIDEGNEFVMSDGFSAAIQNTDNYYVIVTRESIESLPYSVEEIYGIRNSGKYGTLRRTYHEFYHLYGAAGVPENARPDTIITEDSNSGFQFFRGICQRAGQIRCVSAGGKSNVFAETVKHPGERVLVIADGAAFGSEMEKMIRLMQTHPNVALYLPESFEWLILRSGLIEGAGLAEMLDEPQAYIESAEYFSWERFFTAQLIERTAHSYLRYAKRELNPAYLQEKVSEKVLAVMEKIEVV